MRVKPPATAGGSDKNMLTFEVAVSEVEDRIAQRFAEMESEPAAVAAG